MKSFRLVGMGAAAVAVSAVSLPVSETFDDLKTGALNGVSGWTVEGSTARVQTHTAHNGKAVELAASSMFQEISSDHDMLWASFWAMCAGAPAVEPAVTNPDAHVMFYINTNQHLVVYSNSTPLTLHAYIPSHVWTRFDVYCDYEGMTWNLSVNRTNVAAGLPFYSNNRKPALFRFQNQAASPVFVDTVSIARILHEGDRETAGKA